MRGSSAVPCRELCAVISRVPRQAFSSPRARLCLLQLRASRAVPRRRRLRRLAGRCALPWRVLLSDGVAVDAVGPRRAGRAKRFDAFGGLPGAQAPSFFSNESHTTSHRHSCGRYLRVALTNFTRRRPGRRAGHLLPPCWAVSCEPALPQAGRVIGTAETLSALWMDLNSFEFWLRRPQRAVKPA